MARLRRTALLVAAVLTSAAGLAACGGTNGHALDACKRIDRALNFYDRSLSETGTRRDDDLRRAEHQAALALRPAARANSEDGSYNALMTLVQQATELPFANVAAALAASCRQIESGNKHY